MERGRFGASYVKCLGKCDLNKAEGLSSLLRLAFIYILHHYIRVRQSNVKCTLLHLIDVVGPVHSIALPTHAVITDFVFEAPSFEVVTTACVHLAMSAIVASVSYPTLSVKLNSKVCGSDFFGLRGTSAGEATM